MRWINRQISCLGVFLQLSQAHYQMNRLVKRRQIRRKVTVQEF